MTLICKHNVEAEKLYKVTWLKGGGKVFEYINGRQPPYRNFSVPGAEINVKRSTARPMKLDTNILAYSSRNQINTK